MLKRILSLFFCAAMLLSFAACGETEVPGDDSGDAPSSATVSDTSGKTTDTDEVENTDLGFDPEISHQILVCDIMNHSIVQLDLNVCDGDYKLLREDAAKVWEWDADEDPNCKLNPGAGIDDAKYRYSAYYGKDVVIATSSGGKAYVIDYAARTVLWETSLNNGPHSIEMMPNGDVVVAGSGGPLGGSLVYYPLSTGQVKKSSEIAIKSCHGVQWDPVQEVLWVLGYYGMEAVTVKGGQLVQIDGTAVEFDGDEGGHDLAPAYGEPGKYWVTAHKMMWLFDSNEMTLEKKYDYSNRRSDRNVKGVAAFADGVMVQTVGNVGTDLYASWSTKGLRITWPTWNEKKERAELEDVTIIFNDREFYKVHAFCKDYQ